MMNSHLGSNNFSEFNSGTIYLEEQIKNSGFKSVKWLELHWVCINNKYEAKRSECKQL